MNRSLTVFLAAILISAPARAAIELSLEENRAQRGNIGFVDMQRVFKVFPETIRAKENFSEVVRQAEEQINLRKAEILRLRMDLPKFRLELGRLEKRLREAKAMPPPAPPAAPPVETPADQVETPAISTSPRVETVLNALPGFSTSPAAAADIPAAAADPQNDGPAPAAGPPSEVENLGKAVKEAAGKLSLTENRIEELEVLLREHETSAEKSLVDLESRRTELLLGKIHTAIRGVAHGEGISVVVDKSAILYGHSAVDITEKVLQRLKDH